MLAQSASAPGKLILFGEYAVLRGAPAIAMAVNRRAVASIQSTAGIIHAGLDQRLLEHVYDVLRFDGARHPVMQDTGSFYSRPAPGRAPAKLGLGSSAALAAALCILLGGERLDRSALLDLSITAHRNFQGGRGSGVDVATSVVGGLIRYQVDTRAPEALEWPAGLLFRVLWSGVPASTIDKLARLDESPKPASIRELGKAALAISDCWSDGDALLLLDEAERYGRVLRQFDRDHKLGVYAAGHSELAGAAVRSGVFYKPCGAGGGDIGVALGMDELAMDRFVQLAASRGFKALHLGIDQLGASRVDSMHE
ncbi:MAG TPA: hypothetical protein PKK10_01355 [Woeseiaceae bacterium]|nr:hypothetical protein [Woeseiaceae bacterium]